MALSIHSDPPPLRVDEHGACRIGKSRVLLELVIASFEAGASPETIVQQFETTSLADIYAVIAYYLRHREDVAAYIRDRERVAVEVRARIEATQGDLSELLARMRSRVQGRLQVDSPEGGR